MRRVTAMLSAAAIVLAAVSLVAQAKPSFAGKWVMDAAAAPAPPAGGGGGGRGGGRGGGGLGQELTITQDANTMTIEYMAGGQAPAPVKLVYKLDGSASVNKMMARGAEVEQTSKAVWAGSTLVVTTQINMGGNAVEQKRVFAIEGGNLTIETTQPGRDGGPGTPAKVTYKKG